MAIIANGSNENTKTEQFSDRLTGHTELLVGDVGTPPPRTIIRSEGHHAEWYAACRGEKPYNYPRANFEYAAPFTETILAACLVQVAGGRLSYDNAKGKFGGDNADLANSLVSKEYRKGWDYR
jgi:hypothetical protein